MAEDDRDNSGNENPFEGTPMEQIFRAFVEGNQGLDLGALVQQMQHMFTSTSDAAIDFDVVVATARQALGAPQAPQTSVGFTTAAPRAVAGTPGQRAALDDALQLAEAWLDRATDLPRAVQRTTVWDRVTWIEQTADTWRRLIEPIAEHVVGAMGEALPEEARAMAGPLLGMLAKAGGAMFGQQVARGLVELSGEVLSTTDVGFPLTKPGTLAIVGDNVTAFGQGLELTDADVLLYVTLRECAHHRLFAHAPWLRGAIIGAVEEFGRGTRIDVSGIEEKLQGFDLTNPAAIGEAMQGGLFDPEPSAAQKVALERLEALLAFVEGWVDHVVASATADTMPSAAALAEVFRRRRASGGPAEQTFASLVGLQLRPRRLRDAASLWAAVSELRGPAQRDDVWAHPDLMPQASDLDDPIGYAQELGSSPSGDDGFDAELDRLLADASGPTSDDPDADDRDSDDRDGA